MAGHSKWANIKHRKAAVDSKRAKVWTKIIREITVAAKGGDDVSANPRLRKAIDDGRSANIPKDTIERAVKRGSGTAEENSYEELAYEGYAPAGIALYIECTTDNRNRTAGEVISTLKKGGGSLGKSGSVAYMFDKRGTFVFLKTLEEGDESKVADEEILMELGMEHGLEDIVEEDEVFLVYCDHKDFLKLREVFVDAGYKPFESQVAMIPQTITELSGEDAEKVYKLVEKLEELDDVQNVWGNYEISKASLEQLMA